MRLAGSRPGEARTRWRDRPRRRRIAVAALAAVGLLLLPVAAAATALRVQDAGKPAAEARTRGRDAVWLGHAWVDGRKGDAALSALAGQLAGTGIRDTDYTATPADWAAYRRGWC